jgi:hypothetical protein
MAATLRLSDGELTAIDAALLLAADEYRKHADTMRRLGQQRVAEQFRRQVGEAEALRLRIAAGVS